jgi:shikimate kinase
MSRQSIEGKPFGPDLLSAMAPARHVVLIGLMASGKSTIGGALGARLGRPFVDNDVLLQERTGRTAREIADAEGVDRLHRREAEALVAALAQTRPAVIAAAAAAPMEPDAAAAMHGHDVVYLRAPAGVLAARRAGAPADDDHRPSVGSLAAQFDERDARYRELATLVVDTTAIAPDAIVDSISSALSV